MLKFIPQTRDLEVFVEIDNHVANNVNRPLRSLRRGRQLHLGRLLGLPQPAYAHVPMVLGPDRSRLAKRHGAVTLADRAAGGQPAADVRDELAASLALCARGEGLTPAELVGRFSVGNLRAAA